MRSPLPRRLPSPYQGRNDAEKVEAIIPRHYDKLAFLSSGTPEADAARDRLVAHYGDTPLGEADVAVPLGGDGLMIQTLHRLMGRDIPVYGMNFGSIGFLMNDFREDGLRERLAAAAESRVHPLVMRVTDAHGREHEAPAINEVSMLRQTFQAAKLRITIDGKPRLEELVADGILISTPAGSTAYNLSVNGPILPLDSPLMAMTPISAFRPRRWRGALLPDRAKVVIDVLEAQKRPVAAVADHAEFRDIVRVAVAMDHKTGLMLLHDPGHSMEERILNEQFGG